MVSVYFMSTDYIGKMSAFYFWNLLTPVYISFFCFLDLSVHQITYPHISKTQKAYFACTVIGLDWSWSMEKIWLRLVASGRACLKYGVPYILALFWLIL